MNSKVGAHPRKYVRAEIWITADMPCQGTGNVDKGTCHVSVAPAGRDQDAGRMWASVGTIADCELLVNYIGWSEAAGSPIQIWGLKKLAKPPYRRLRRTGVDPGRRRPGTSVRPCKTGTII